MFFKSSSRQEQGLTPYIVAADVPAQMTNIREISRQSAKKIESTGRASLEVLSKIVVASKGLRSKDTCPSVGRQIRAVPMHTRTCLLNR